MALVPKELVSSNLNIGFEVMGVLHKDKWVGSRNICTRISNNGSGYMLFWGVMEAARE